MRRVGKSSIVKLLITHLREQGIPEKAILYINKESLVWDFIRDYADLNKYVIETFKGIKGEKFLFIDEVQEIYQWEKAVNSFLTDNIADLTITGSNAGLLASELASLLSGRYIDFSIHPLSFKEFLLFRGKKSGNERDEFRLYLRYGGMPGIHNLSLRDDMIFPYLNALYSSIVLKDVVSRNQIRDPALLDLIIRFVFDNCGNITTAKRITDYLKNQRITVSVDKVIKYIAYLEEAFLLHRVRRYDIKGLRHLELYEKYYVGDIGLRHGFLGYRDGDISGLLENLIYLELKQRGFKVSIGKIDNLEVDFIAETQQEKLYIQVTLELSEEKTIEREFSILERIPDNHEKIVLSMDEFQKIQRRGIKHKSIIDFLLEL
ncbi:MAG: ATP-binding protein [Spirochaetaceae bacterium]|nr:ATP-binding protein [Spirochaetaceae bacterium]